METNNFTRWAYRGAMIAAAAITLVSAPALANRSLIKSASSWTYQLKGNVGEIYATSADVAVVDWDHIHDRSVIEKLKHKSGGGRRLVIGYLAIGEAENWRSYWKSCCSGGNRPSWLTSKTQGWSGNYATRYWDPGWKAIVMNRLNQLIDAGFDGVYLDRADTWETMRGENSNARSAMIQLVKDVSAAARGRKGEFAIMVQNAEELLTDGSYVAAIDAIAKEDLFHGIDHNGSRNSSSDVNHSVALLKTLKARGKAIYVIEYLSGSTAEKVRGEIRAQGFIRFSAHAISAVRSTDPTQAKTPQPVSNWSGSSPRSRTFCAQRNSADRVCAR